MIRLFVARYDDPTYTSGPSGVWPDETFEDFVDLGIRWGLPWGIQRIELTIEASSEVDAYERYQNHLGHRITVYDQFIDRPIGGQVYEIVPEGRFVTYICAGPGKRFWDDVYTVSDHPGASPQDTHIVMKDIMTDSVSIEGSGATYAELEDSNVTTGGWAPDERVGTPAGQAIMELAAAGDASNNAMDFYLRDQTFNETSLRQPWPYFKSQSNTANPDWQFSRADLVQGGMMLARNIWGLKRNVGVAYGRLSGQHDGGNNQANLTDSGASFITAGVNIGDTVINMTDKCYSKITAVAATVLTLEGLAGGTDDDFDNNDRYVVKLGRPVFPAATSDSTETDLWTTIHYEEQPKMDSTMAGNYEDWLLATYEKPQQQQSFVIGAPTIKDGNGAEWPLWRVFMGETFYFRVTDLFPESALFTASDDRAQSFMAVAMDYTYRNNRLRVVPSTEDSRLDSMLVRAGFADGYIVSTESGARIRARERRQ
jgi:hypothetical protein